MVEIRLDETLAANQALMTVNVLKGDLKTLWTYRRPGYARRFWQGWYESGRSNATRAGEQGRGFAVVAGEVRLPAGRSGDAAKEIKKLITDSVERVEQGSQLVNKAGETMSEVVRGIQRVTAIMAEIGSATRAECGSGPGGRCRDADGPGHSAKCGVGWRIGRFPRKAARLLPHCTLAVCCNA